MTAPTRTLKQLWPLALTLVCFVVGTVFAVQIGQDFNRLVVTGLWFAVGLVWIAVWRSDVRKRRRAASRADPAHPADPGHPTGTTPRID